MHINLIPTLTSISKNNPEFIGPILIIFIFVLIHFAFSKTIKFIYRTGYEEIFKPKNEIIWEYLSMLLIVILGIEALSIFFVSNWFSFFLNFQLFKFFVGLVVVVFFITLFIIMVSILKQFIFNPFRNWLHKLLRKRTYQKKVKDKNKLLHNLSKVNYFSGIITYWVYLSYFFESFSSFKGENFDDALIVVFFPFMIFALYFFTLDNYSKQEYYKIQKKNSTLIEEKSFYFIMKLKNEMYILNEKPNEHDYNHFYLYDRPNDQLFEFIKKSNDEKC